MLFILHEAYTNGYRAEILDIISLLSILCGIFVIISKNPIVSVLFLIGLFLSISCYLIILGINFIGLSYLLVYVGAVSILFLFILMLINVRISELLSDTSNSIPLAIFVSLANYFTVYHILPYSITTELIKTMDNVGSNYYVYTNTLGSSYSILDKGEVSFATSQMWDGNLAELSHITSIGNIMYTNYNIWIIITSIILLLAMVGAIVITVKQTKQ